MTASVRAIESSDARALVASMRGLGYVPDVALRADRVCFYKDYADASYVFRVYVFFDKPVMGLQGVRLSSIAVTIQASLAPTHEAVSSLVPETAHADLFEVLEGFDTQIERASVDTRDCIKCSNKSADFYVVNGDAVCATCVAQRG